VAQGSFSQQRQATASQQEQGRITRTQRIAQEQEQKKAKYQYDMWSAEAERLRSEIFIDKPIQETYQEEVVDSRGRKSIVTKTRTITDPFTFEEYTQEYGKLDPNIKQFFASPESITAEQESKKQVQRTALQTTIQQASERLARAKQKLAEFIEYERNYNYSDNSERRERQKKSNRERERDLELDVYQYQDQIQEAQGNSGKIEQGALANDIWNYAEDKADYDRNRRESKDKAKDKFNQSIKTGEIKTADLLKLGFKEGEKVDYNKFVGAVDKYNKNIAYNNQILAWRDKVGYDKLPDYAKAIVNKDAVAWQKANPTEKLVFDKMGNVVGIESGKLQQSMNIQNYNKLASKTPDDYYKEWETKQKNKPLDLDIKIVDTGFLPYQTRGTINTQASTKQFVIGGSGTGSSTPQGFLSFFGSMPVIKQGVQGYNWVKDRVHWDLSLTGSPSLPQVNLISFGLKEKETNIEQLAGTGKEKLAGYSTKVDEWVLGKENINALKEEKEAKFQGLYQNEFERQYMKKLIYGETTFEEASASFSESKEAKRLEQRYSEEYGAGYKQLQTDVNFFSLKGVTGGVAQTGLGLGSFGIDLLDNPVDLGATAGTIWAGGTALKYLGTGTKLALTGGFFISGVKTTFDPTKTYAERGGGLVTASLTGASLGYAGARYLKSPVIKTAKIPKPKADLWASETIGKDLKAIFNGKSFNKVLYGEQKLSQVSQAGRRTIVTTKWRSLMNKYLGTNLKNIYDGIPSKQRAIYGSDVFRGGRVKITQSGYEKAIKKLTDYGYTKGQASRTLRFYAPKTTEQWLKSGQIKILDDKTASGKFIYEERKAVFDVGDGIKTRGGRTIQQVYNVERKIVEINNQNFMLEMKSNVGKYLNKRGIGVKVKDVGFSTSVNRAWASDTKQGMEWLRKQGGVDIYKDPAFYKDIYSVSKGGISITATPKRTKTIIEIMNKQRSYNLGKTKLFDWELDFDKAMAGSGKNIIIQKGNKGAFGSDKVSQSVDKIVEKITGQKTSPSVKTDFAPAFSDQKVTQLTEQLKGGLDLAPVKKSKMGGISKVKQGQLIGLDVGLGLGSVSKLKSNLKMNNAIKMQLKEISQLKVNQISSQLLKQQLKQQTAQRTAPLLRFQTPQLNLQLLMPRLNVPTMKTPPVKPFPKILLFGDEELKAKIKAKKGRRSPESFALLPDFTSRAIGLAPKEFGSVKDAMREIRMLQTGFGIRRGGRIKGFSPIDEKSLLKGIMK